MPTVYPDVPRLHVPVECTCPVAARACGNAIEEHRDIWNLTEVCSLGVNDNKSSLVQVMAWHRTGAKTLVDPIMT